MNKEQFYKFLININYSEKKKENEIVIRGDLCEYAEELKNLIKDIFRITEKKEVEVICDYEKPYEIGQVLIIDDIIQVVISADNNGRGYSIDIDGDIDELSMKDDYDSEIREATREEIAAFVNDYKGKGFILFVNK
jgi:hypothetical protein